MSVVMRIKKSLSNIERKRKFNKDQKLTVKPSKLRFIVEQLPYRGSCKYSLIQDKSKTRFKTDLKPGDYTGLVIS